MNDSVCSHRHCQSTEHQDTGEMLIESVADCFVSMKFDEILRDIFPKDETYTKIVEAKRAIQKEYVVMIVFIVGALVATGTVYQFMVKPLEEKLGQARQNNILLEQQLTPFKTVALQFYGEDNGGGLEKLVARIQEVDKSVSDLLAVQQYASWDSSGRVHTNWGSSAEMITDGPIAGWLTNYVSRLSPKDDTYNPSCGNYKIAGLVELTQKYPLYPFPYHLLYLCYKEKGDQKNSDDYKQKAIDLYKNTTAVPNHHSDHDNFLKQILL